MFNLGCNHMYQTLYYIHLSCYHLYMPGFTGVATNFVRLKPHVHVLACVQRVYMLYSLQNVKMAAYTIVV